ncbi:membrane protein [Rhodopirellula maiorica SM1]|uniref:Membrane protein n=1 Tax=Rhodopirellula maiorica SM1 TaxID=1265738 RepID=M5RR02_9BACT|nr:membrane protein [Rhodopirellula maiorica SM1]
MYGTRVLISVAVPIGGTLDIICGVVSTSLASKLTGFQFEPTGVANNLVTFGESFFPVLLTTLIQGSLMNVVLAIYGIVVFGIVLAIRAMSGSSPPPTEKTIAVDPSSLNS